MQIWCFIFEKQVLEIVFLKNKIYFCVLKIIFSIRIMPERQDFHNLWSATKGWAICSNHCLTGRTKNGQAKFCLAGSCFFSFFSTGRRFALTYGYELKIGGAKIRLFKPSL